MAFENQRHYKVQFLTGNRGSDDHTGKAAEMPALAGAAAEPQRFLDFLIRDPGRTVFFHRTGIPVTVPAPARYPFTSCLLPAVGGMIARAFQNATKTSSRQS